MKVYLDTSSLFKLYHKETGTEDLERILFDNSITAIFLSEITNVEFISAIFKRVRMKELNMNDAEQIINLFNNDIKNYTIIPVSSATVELAKAFILKYGQEGLRTLDALQLASAIEVKELINTYFTADKILLSFFEKEHLPIS